MFRRENRLWSEQLLLPHRLSKGVTGHQCIEECVAHARGTKAAELSALWGSVSVH
jgi:hypothetical protein